jgi:hypothetical protein
MKQPQTGAFPAKKLAPLLRAIADPEGKGVLSAKQEDAIRRVEANVARHKKHR